MVTDLSEDEAMEKTYYVEIMASQRRVVHIGITSYIGRRVRQHKSSAAGPDPLQAKSDKAGAQSEDILLNMAFGDLQRTFSQLPGQRAVR
jgi:hypothetical protein